MKTKLLALTFFPLALILGVLFFAFAFTPLPIVDDPLVRMPGTQPEQGVNLQEPLGCINCHGEKDLDKFGNTVAPGFSWSGSMMAQAARDPIFWAAMTVAAQDSIWALGNPNAVDICERCHFPEGWLGGRSDPPNASLMTGSDFDGVHCDFCHRMGDPFFKTTFDGTREGAGWAGYWDENGNTGPGSGTQSQNRADLTYVEDAILAGGILLFSHQPFYMSDLPKYSATYLENSGGQYFVDLANVSGKKRSSFADTVPDHTVLYSRYHKSKYFCSTCHDVSNPVLANMNLSGLPDQSGGTDLITEQYSAGRYFHVERTFSEFILSAYGQQDGAPTNPEFQMQGARTITRAAKCQDCHMRDIRGKGCGEAAAPLRPDQSTEHPNSGAPLHDLQGGNLWITRILASLDDHFPNTYDPVNYQLLSQGPQTLTLNLFAGISPTDNGAALLAASERARLQLKLAATIKSLSYDQGTGDISFRIQNNTGHKLISGFPEGRRMFANIKAYAGGQLIYEVNPYDYSMGTLKGLPNSTSSPSLSAQEAYVDELVYETHPKSDLTGEDETFHFVLATGRYKDNRIPPKGFDITNAAARMSEPVWHGVSQPAYFSAAEYAGGYDDINLTGILPPGADHVRVTLFYQGTSREYVEFLRDEINGTATTLSVPTPFKPGGDPGAYIAQTDPFFSGLKAWGNAIWNLWYHNHGLDGSGARVDGIVPVEMTRSMAPESQSAGDLVTHYYDSILDRTPELGGFNFWVGEVQRMGSLGLDIKEGFIAVGKAFFNSDEYLLMAKTDAAYVTDLYETFLQRTPSQSEIDYWVGFLTSGMSRNIALNYFVYSPEFKLYMEEILGVAITFPENNLVNDFYRGFMNRLPDTSGFNGYLELMRTAQCTGNQAVKDLSHEIALGFIQSAEYGLRGRTDSQFVEDLYDGILRRGALPSEVSYWVLFLGTATRAEVLQYFTDSPEFQIRVQHVIDAGCLP